ncbi:hypothetical protein PUN28_019707 [Cardiocondyla obscurior]|uniref:Uncharacterized protein n=1 Tax=Cardiocondyla obscurior TaxID=286306 RepID=A0AAW2EED1_9HYME
MIIWNHPADDSQSDPENGVRENHEGVDSLCGDPSIYRIIRSHGSSTQVEKPLEITLKKRNKIAKHVLSTRKNRTQ